jgi:hypothetical protein
MEEKPEINNILKKSKQNYMLKYIEENKFLLLSLLFIIIFFISINYNIYSNYTINLFNNIYFKFALFLIFIHIMTKNLIMALILIILLLYISQKVSIHNINKDFNEDDI